MRAQLSIIGMVIALAACGPVEPPRDKAFFAANPEERAKILAVCRNDPARRDRNAECGNALAADSEAEQKRVFHEHPAQPTGVSNASRL